jgi:predicted RNase H-like nuclease
VRFVGCALAWRPGEARDRSSALVVLDERGGIIANAFAAGVEELAGAIESYAGGEGVLVGVDAPLSIPNERGTREVERILSRVSLPAYSASRKMFGEEVYPEEFLAALERVGIQYTDYPFPRDREQRAVVEVNSAATLKVISFERAGSDGRLEEIREPRYRKGNKAQRAAALREVVEILWNTPGLRLRTGNLSDDLSAPENVDVSRIEVTEEMSHAELDRIMNLVEGTLAAYTVLRHWRGRDGSLVVGTGPEGYVLIPAPEILRRRIAEECRAAGVPYV